MRRQRLLRGTSTQDLCLFCAYRLIIGDLPPSIPLTFQAIPKRRFNTARHSYQSVAAATVPAENNDQNSEPKWTGFDPNSTLSPSEQREKALLRQKREELEHQAIAAQRERYRLQQDAVREAEATTRPEQAAEQQAEQQRLHAARPVQVSIKQAPEQQRHIRARVAEEKSRQGKAQQQAEQQRQQAEIIRRWRQEQDQLQPAVQGSQLEAQQQSQHDTKSGAMPIRKIGAPPAPNSWMFKLQEPRDANRRTIRQGRLTRGGGHLSLSLDRRSEDALQAQQSHSEAVGENESVSHQQKATYGERERRHENRSNPSPSKQQQQDTTPPKRIAIPDFGRLMSSAGTQTFPSGDGWGTGPVERAPVNYGDGVPESEKNDETISSSSEPQSSKQTSRQALDDWHAPSNASDFNLHSNRGMNMSRRQTLLQTSTRANLQDSSQSEMNGLRDLGASTFSFKPSSEYGLQSPPQPADHPFRSFDSGIPSSTPSQPKPTSEYDEFNESGYRATLFDPQELFNKPQAQADRENYSTEWQHLRRRNPNPPPPPPPSMSAEPHRDWQDDSWIDESFQRHQAARQSQPVRQPYSPFVEPAASPAPNPFQSQVVMANKRCGRCGESGHVARECAGPIRARCRLCGRVGHFEKDCPQNRGQNERYERHEHLPSAEVTSKPFGAAVDGRKRPNAREELFERTSAFPVREEAVPQRRDEDRNAVHNVERRELSSDHGEGVHSAAGPGPSTNERALRSRKFVDEPPKHEKSGRRARRDEDDEEDDEAFARREERNAQKAARKSLRHQELVEKAAEEKAEKARRAALGAPVNLPEFVSVSQLGQLLGERYERFVKTLEKLGYDDVFPGRVLNREISGMIAMEYGFEPVYASSTENEEEERDLKARPAVEDTSFLPARPPVVTIMGHVDHGKTTILDHLRKSSVAAGEAGGITQHIGAFSVPLTSSGKTITFLDTPGHAAFLAMRRRGANVTDIVILVVAADDSVKPQTLEAIKHARAASVPIIVAINKVDKEEADVRRCKQDLARHGIEIEDFGGETQVVCVSGKTGQGMDELEESVVTLSEILDHRAETEGAVEGWVLEATTKKAGRVATVLVRRGTLKPGAILVAGKTWARVRTLKNEGGQTLREIGPGMPVEVDGWRDQAIAGDEVLQAPSEQKANEVVEYRVEKAEREKTAVDTEAINESKRLEQEKRQREAMVARAAKGADQNLEEAAKVANSEGKGDELPSGKMEVPFIIKADVSGSAEAVSAYILSISSPFIAPRILHSSVGPVHESDVELASAASGHIISFNLPTDEGMKGRAESRGVRVLENNVIYRVLDDVKGVLEAKLPEIVTQRVLGEAEIGASFDIGVGGRKKARIAGCKVRNGVVGRGSRVRVTRGEGKVYDGTISSLKNVKKDVQEMRKGSECGMGFEEWEGFEVGDVVQTYEEVREKRKL